ncbi:MAG: ribbon-helix-helix domain-containing protein [Verrucomicrobiota bacterium JB022]|nr:ribbon-helix-helix domain-containing protein [Verrucomicrobiota bacterium JB022]
MVSSSSPVSFEVEQPLWQRLQSLADHAGHLPISRLVETALNRLAAQPLPEAPPPRRQMSVRLKPELRDVLDQLSEEAGLSRSRLIREALEALVEHPPLEWMHNGNGLAKKPAASPATPVEEDAASASSRRKRRLGAGPAPRARRRPGAEVALVGESPGLNGKRKPKKAKKGA